MISSLHFFYRHLSMTSLVETKPLEVFDQSRHTKTTDIFHSVTTNVDSKARVILD